MLLCSGCGGCVSAAISERLRELATQESDVRVRCQLACSAKRLPTSNALPVIERLALRAEDANDPYLPLLLWWALERHALRGREQVVEFFSAPSAWDSVLIRETILERLLRRYFRRVSLHTVLRNFLPATVYTCWPR